MSEIHLNIKKVVDELLPSALKIGLEAVGQLVENESKINCPHDDGQLRTSITHQVEDTAVYIGTNVEYAPYVHNGTGIYAKDGNGRKTPWSFEMANGDWITTSGQEPRPFISDAVYQNMDKLVKPFENLLDKQRRG